MKTGLKPLRLVAVGLVASALLIALLVGTALAQGPDQPGGFGWRGHGPGMMGGWQGMGPGMMDRWGTGIAPTTGTTDTLPYGPANCPGMGSEGQRHRGGRGRHRFQIPIDPGLRVQSQRRNPTETTSNESARLRLCDQSEPAMRPVSQTSSQTSFRYTPDTTRQTDPLHQYERLASDCVR